MYKIAICDDEPELREHLKMLCQEILLKQNYNGTVTSFSNTLELFHELKNDPDAYDLLLLDICMDGPSGMELAKKLRILGNRISIIFVTGSVEYLLEGYSVQPLQYLMKPVTSDALQKAIGTDLQLNHLPKTIVFEAGKKKYQLEFEDILYLESMNHELYIHLTKEKISIPMSLGNALSILPADSFCRCHKSYLVNLYWIRSVTHNSILLKNGAQLPLGRNYSNDVQSSFVRYLNRL